MRDDSNPGEATNRASAPGAKELLAASQPGAVDIYQGALDIIGNLFWSRDWEPLRDHILVPNRITALDTERIVHSLDEWIHLAKAARESFVRLGATEYHRLCRSAWFEDEDCRRISGVHETFILRGSTLVMPPHQGFLMLWQCDDGRWRSDGLRADKRDTVLPTIHADRITPPKL